MNEVLSLSTNYWWEFAMQEKERIANCTPDPVPASCRLKIRSLKWSLMTKLG